MVQLCKETGDLRYFVRYSWIPLAAAFPAPMARITVAARGRIKCKKGTVFSSSTFPAIPVPIVQKHAAPPSPRAPASAQTIPSALQKKRSSIIPSHLLIMQSLCHRNQHQQHHDSHQTNDNAQNHLGKYHSQAHTDAQQQCPDHTHGHRGNCLSA